MNEDIIIVGSFFFTVIVLALGIPLVRAYTRRQSHAPAPSRLDLERDERLARIETAIDTLAVEMERVSEGQRFVTRLLAERPGAGALPREGRADGGGHEVPR